MAMTTPRISFRLAAALLFVTATKVFAQGNPPCNVCGSDAAYMTDLTAVVVFPPELADRVPVPQATCDQIFQAGQFGLLAPEDCSLVQSTTEIKDALEDICGCTDPNAAAAPEPTDAGVPVKAPTETPVKAPSREPSPKPFPAPSRDPTLAPVEAIVPAPVTPPPVSLEPTPAPSPGPSTESPVDWNILPSIPTAAPSAVDWNILPAVPTAAPSPEPSKGPTAVPTSSPEPTESPSPEPTDVPTVAPVLEILPAPVVAPVPTSPAPTAPAPVAEPAPMEPVPVVPAPTPTAPAPTTGIRPVYDVFNMFAPTNVEQIVPTNNNNNNNNKCGPRPVFEAGTPLPDDCNQYTVGGGSYRRRRNVRVRK
jgi:hypothetical protein